MVDIKTEYEEDEKYRISEIIEEILVYNDNRKYSDRENFYRQHELLFIDEYNNEYTDRVLYDNESLNLSYLHDLFFLQGIYFLSIKKDLNKSKQSFYLSAKTSEYRVKIFDDEGALEYSELTCVLLSDNLNIIKKYADLKDSNYLSRVKKGDIVVIAQAIIRDNWDLVKEQINIIKAKKSNKIIFPDMDFFEALMNGNIEKMKEAILFLLTPRKHKQRNRPIVISQYISIPALTYAKLAYIKGYELDIDHPLIPKELLPVKPNDEYWEYDFMKEGKYKDV